MRISAKMILGFRSILAVGLLVTSFAAAAQELPSAKPESVGLSSERLDRIAAKVQQDIDQKRIAGAVTLVARHGKVVWFTNAPPDMVQISFALFALLCQRMSSVPLPLKSPLANGVQLFVLLGRTLCELNVPFEDSHAASFAIHL